MTINKYKKLTSEFVAAITHVIDKSSLTFIDISHITGLPIHILATIKLKRHTPYDWMTFPTINTTKHNAKYWKFEHALALLEYRSALFAMLNDFLISPPQKKYISKFSEEELKCISDLALNTVYSPPHVASLINIHSSSIYRIVHHVGDVVDEKRALVPPHRHTLIRHLMAVATPQFETRIRAIKRKLELENRTH